MRTFETAIAAFLSILFPAADGLAAGHEGFYIGFGYGAGIYGGDKVVVNARGANEMHGYFIPEADKFFTGPENPKAGSAIDFKIGYNILGYASVEFNLTGHGWALGTENQGGDGFVGGSAKFHPFQLFMPERPFEASVYLGGGYTIIGQKDGFAYEGSYIRTGVDGEYYVLKWLSLGLDLKFLIPLYKDNVYFNYGDDLYWRMEAPSAFVFAPMATATLHFTTAK